MDLLSSPIWVVIGAIAAVVIIPITIMGSRKSRSYLTYSVIYDVPIPFKSLSKKVENLKIEVLFDGKEIQDELRLVVFKFMNIGNEVIKPDDFDKDNTGNPFPIKFNFGDEAKVLDVKIIERNSSEDLDDVFKSEEVIQNDGKVLITPHLLKPQESITLQALVIGYTADRLKMTARYNDPRKTERKDDDIIVRVDMKSLKEVIKKSNQYGKYSVYLGVITVSTWFLVALLFRWLDLFIGLILIPYATFIASIWFFFLHKTYEERMHLMQNKRTESESEA